MESMRSNGRVRRAAFWFVNFFSIKKCSSFVVVVCRFDLCRLVFYYRLNTRSSIFSFMLAYFRHLRGRLPPSLAIFLDAKAGQLGKSLQKCRSEVSFYMSKIHVFGPSAHFS